MGHYDDEEEDSELLPFDNSKYSLHENAHWSLMLAGNLSILTQHLQLYSE